MAWVELHVTTTLEHTSSIEAQLSLLGAQALTLRDAGCEVIYEPAPFETPVWKKSVIVGLFDETECMEPILDYMQTQKNCGFIEDFQLISLPDQHWERICLQDFKPLQFGKRLWI